MSRWKPITLDSIEALSASVIIEPLREKDQGELHELRNENLVVLRQQEPAALWDQIEWWMRIGRALPFFTATIDAHKAYFGLTPRGNRDWELSYLETSGAPEELVFACVNELINSAEDFNATRISAISHLVPERSVLRTSLLQMGFKREGCVRKGYYDQREGYAYDEILYGFVLGVDRWLSGMEELRDEELPF